MDTNELPGLPVEDSWCTGSNGRRLPARGLSQLWLDRIAVIQGILEEYGPPMKVRQIAYQCLSRGKIITDMKQVETVGDAIKYGRLANMIAWGDITDGVREFQGERYGHTMSTEDALRQHELGVLEDVIQQLRCAPSRYWLEGQPCHVEAYIEKDGLIEQLAPTFHHYGIGFCASRGEDSLTQIARAARRFSETRKPVIILAAADFDYAGHTIICNLHEWLRALPWDTDHVEIRRIALNLDQVRDNNLYTLEATEAGKKLRDWLEVTAGDPIKCELDALPPDVLRQIFVDAIEQVIDLDAPEANKQLEEDEDAIMENKWGDLDLDELIEFVNERAAQ